MSEVDELALLRKTLEELSAALRVKDGIWLASDEEIRAAFINAREIVSDARRMRTLL